MKILICGKGGCGKSTVSTVLARTLSQKGRDVLLVDADESNHGLHDLLGTDPPVNLMENLGGKPGVKEKMQASSDAFNPVPIFNARFKVEDLPAPCVAEADGVRLLALGKIRKFGEGCGCMLGALTKRFLTNIVLEPKQVVVVDMEAGVEHFGRGVDAGCDLVIGVVDPSRESVLLSGSIIEMADNANLDAALILNRVDETTAPVIAEKLDPNRVLGQIPAMDSLFTAGLEGRPLTQLPEGIDSICDAILARVRG
ncbi:MAG: P-loop NTPase [Desulfatibacillaceae bacterium]